MSADFTFFRLETPAPNPELKTLEISRQKCGFSTFARIVNFFVDFFGRDLTWKKIENPLTLKRRKKYIPKNEPFQKIIYNSSFVVAGYRR